MAATPFRLFPITRYTGEYVRGWTNNWVHVGGAFQFFAKPWEMVVDNDGRGFAWDDPDFGYYAGEWTRCGIHDDWGAFHLAGLVQINAKNGSLRKACGLVSVSPNNLRMFRRVGKRMDDMRQSLWAEYLESLGEDAPYGLRQRVTKAPWYAPDVYCIPCAGKGDIK